MIFWDLNDSELAKSLQQISKSNLATSRKEVLNQRNKSGKHNDLPLNLTSCSKPWATDSGACSHVMPCGW